MDTLDTFFNNTTSQFYVVLTGTSSFLSGVMMFLEWLHFTYFGISIVDRLSSVVLHFFPFLSQQKNKDISTAKKKVTDLRPVRNPMMLFRGAEYNRFFMEAGKEPLTEYDVSLTTSDLQNIFCYEYLRIDTSVDEITMLHAWREEDRKKRIDMAHKAIFSNPHNPGALIISPRKKPRQSWKSKSSLGLPLSPPRLHANRVTFSASRTRFISHSTSEMATSTPTAKSVLPCVCVSLGR